MAGWPRYVAWMRVASSCWCRTSCRVWLPRQYASSDVAACRCCRTSSQARCPRNALP